MNPLASAFKTALFAYSLVSVSFAPPHVTRHLPTATRIISTFDTMAWHAETYARTRTLRSESFHG